MLKSNDYRYGESSSRNSSSPSGSLDRSMKRSRRDVDADIRSLKKKLLSYVGQATTLEHKHRSISGSRKRLNTLDKLELDKTLDQVQRELDDMLKAVKETVAEIQFLDDERRL